MHTPITYWIYREVWKQGVTHHELIIVAADDYIDLTFLRTKLEEAIIQTGGGCEQIVFLSWNAHSIERSYSLCIRIVLEKDNKHKKQIDFEEFSVKIFNFSIQ